MDDNMPGFSSPNYTQVPNDLFDVLMADMTMAELKVVLAIVRQTIGYHREATKFSLSKIQKMTGMAYNSVVTGADAAEKRGLIRRTNPDEQGSAEWEAIIEPPSTVEGIPPQNLKVTPSTVEGQLGLNKDKESINKNKRKSKVDTSNFPVDWQVALGKEVSPEQQAAIVRENELLSEYERSMGYNPLPWNSPRLQRLRRFLIQQKPEDIRAFAAWSNRKYSSFNPSKARSYPDQVIDNWPQAFIIHKEAKKDDHADFLKKLEAA